MLKIKFNINEFTIIFSKKIGKKINAEKLSAQPSLFNFNAAFLCSSSLFLSASVPLSSAFLFWSAPLSSLVLFTQCPPFLLSVFLLYSFVFSASFFFSSRRVALFLSAQKKIFSPKRFLLQPKTFFSA